MVLQLWEHSGTLLAAVPATQDAPPSTRLCLVWRMRKKRLKPKNGWEGRTKGINEPVKVSPHLYFAAPMLSLKIHLPKSCCGMFYGLPMRTAEHQASRNYKSRAFIQQPSTEALHKHLIAINNQDNTLERQRSLSPRAQSGRGMQRNP